MGIRFHCPNGHRMNVKAFLAGKRGICPDCGARFEIPHEDQVHTAGDREVASVDDESTRSRAARADGRSAEPASLLDSATEVGTLVAPADPIAAAPDAVWYVRPRSGGQYGPAASQIMRQWIDDGRVGHDALVWRDGWQDWLPASDALATLLPEPEPALSFPNLDLVADTAPRSLASLRTNPNHSSRNLVVGLLAAVVVLGIVLATVMSR